MTDDQRIEDLWRFGGLVRRRRTHSSGFIQEMLNWRGYALTWPGGERLRFVSDARDGKWRAEVIVVAAVIIALVMMLGR